MIGLRNQKVRRRRLLWTAVNPPVFGDCSRGQERLSYPLGPEPVRHRGQHMRRLAIALGLSLACSGAASAGDVRLAYFHSSNIFDSGLRGAHTLALTFDDGPSPNTYRVLDTLRKYDVKATFFIVGKMAKQYPHIVAAIAADGHLLANHTGSHPKLGSRYSSRPQLLLDQLQVVHDYIAPYIKPGERLFFRAPYGAWRSAHAAILNEDPVLKYYIGPIFWDVGGETSINASGYIRASADWDCWRRGWSASTCGKGYLREARRRDGGVVLMHDVHRKTGDMLAEVLPVLVNEGFRFVRLDEMPAYDRYETPEDLVDALIAWNAAN